MFSRDIAAILLWFNNAFLLYGCCYRKTGQTWPNVSCNQVLCNGAYDVIWGIASLAIQAVSAFNLNMFDSFFPSAH
jgi:hypothetical protein